MEELAKRFGTKIRQKATVLYGGITLTRQLRAKYRGHKLELLANDDLMLLDVEALFGQFELITVNPRPMRLIGEHAGRIKTRRGKYDVFTFGGTLSGPQSELCTPRALGQVLDVIIPGEGEEINVSQSLFRVYLDRPSLTRIMRIIDAVVDFMPHEKKEEGTEANVLPDALRPLTFLIAMWAIDDDEERSRKLKRCAISTRRKLVDTVVPLLPEINRFLNSFGRNPPEEACALGSLAQAALEAQALLSSTNR